MIDLIETVGGWLSAQTPVALATVTKTWGSAPRRAGSKLAVTPAMAMIGSVSGGCVEGAVIEEALITLKSGTVKLLHFGIADDVAWDVGLTCGGSIRVLVEVLDQTWWHLAQKCFTNHQLSKTITLLDGECAGQKIMFDAEGAILYQTDSFPVNKFTDFSRLATETQQSEAITWAGTQLFVDVIHPRPHLVIIGGVHVAIPLEALARTMGFRVSLIDPRKAFATAERFPSVETIYHDYPANALAKVGLHRDTYLAVLTHDPKIDDQALLTALPAQLPYVGVLSSRRTHAARKIRLREAGLGDDLIDQLYTPIGLELGSRTPEDIALGIMAEIVAVRNGVHKTVL